MPPGRCWIFSCLNVMRLPFMKMFNIEEFEFSQSYLFFWDKVRTIFSVMCHKPQMERHVFLSNFVSVVLCWTCHRCLQHRWTTHFPSFSKMTEVHIRHNQFYIINLSFRQIERCNYFLHSYVETAQRKEPVDGRLVQFLLSNPSNDGGQWDMLVNLIG